MRLLATSLGGEETKRLVPGFEVGLENRRSGILIRLPTPTKSVHDAVLHAYYKSTGLPIENLDLQTPTTNFADSISFVRVRDSLRKELGFTLTAEEMVDYPNIASQIKLLQKRKFQSPKNASLFSETFWPSISG